MGAVVDQVLARETSGGTVAWYLPDRLGTIRDIVDNTGAIIDHVDYGAYGKVLDESAPSLGDRLTGFGGLERDTATGLNLAIYRVQDPGTGRWLSEDPLGLAGGSFNAYSYVVNAPSNLTDQQGEFPIIPVIIIGIGALLWNPTKAYAPGPKDPTPSEGQAPLTGILLFCAGGTLAGRLASGAMQLGPFNGGGGQNPPGGGGGGGGGGGRPAQGAPPPREPGYWAPQPSVPIGTQLQGKGQIKDLLSNPNLKGVDVRGLLGKTPQQLDQMCKAGQISAKTLKQLKKPFEGRDLGKRGGG